LVNSAAKQAVRVLGLALFIASLALLAWWWARVAGHDRPGGGWTAAGANAALFTAFALHHSVLARSSAKRLVERLVPSEFVRTTYVVVASLLLGTVCVFWQPVGGLLFSATGVVAALLLSVQLLGVAIAVLAVRRISVRELAGLADPTMPDQLQSGGPYRLVRHPLYLGWVLFFFFTPHMTADRLLFAAISTLYLVIAMPFEEAALAKQFGNRYVQYRRSVRWRLIPYLH
jgi:protein-S-isoprenylcysteine O-methyltransferase Ste14